VKAFTKRFCGTAANGAAKSRPGRVSASVCGRRVRVTPSDHGDLRLPDFFAGPFPGPFQDGDRVPGSGAGRRLDLDEVAGCEPAPVQQPDHVVMADVDLDRVAGQPVETAHTEIRPPKRFGRQLVVLLRPGPDDLDGAGQEDQLSAGA
jgi:hypothetical protein